MKKWVPILMLFFLISAGCKRAEAPEPETVRVFSLLLPENCLFTSEDGGVWGLDHRIRQDEGGPERVVAQRYGPVFLPATEDVGVTFSLQITGIRKVAMPDPADRPDWWFLDYTYEQADRKPKAITLSLQILLDGQWYLLPSGGLTPESVPDQPGSVSLMKGRLYPDQQEQIIPGHYRLVLLRDWRGEVSLDVKEFDLLETAEGFSIDHIRKPSTLFAEEIKTPGGRILREDGSAWSLAEAGALNDWGPAADILEAVPQNG